VGWRKRFAGGRRGAPVTKASKTAQRSAEIYTPKEVEDYGRTDEIDDVLLSSNNTYQSK